MHQSNSVWLTVCRTHALQALTYDGYTRADGKHFDGKQKEPLTIVGKLCVT